MRCWCCSEAELCSSGWARGRLLGWWRAGGRRKTTALVSALLGGWGGGVEFPALGNKAVIRIRRNACNSVPSGGDRFMSCALLTLPVPATAGSSLAIGCMHRTCRGLCPVPMWVWLVCPTLANRPACWCAQRTSLASVISSPHTTQQPNQHGEMVLRIRDGQSPA